MTLNLAKCHACHANSRGDQGARRQSQPSAISATPATQRDGRCRQVPLLPHKVKWRSMSPCATPAAQNRRRCHQAPRLPRQMTLDVAKCHALPHKVQSQRGNRPCPAVSDWRNLSFGHLAGAFEADFLVMFTFDKVHNPLRLPRETTSEPPKVVRTPGVFNTLTSKCASRHNGVHFFDISTSKSGPDLVCFVHFDFEMCFAPQRRALFRRLNFQICPNMVCFVHFDFEMCLAPQRRALLPHSQLPKVVRVWCVLYILTSKCASRDNGLQFFISHLASWLRTCRFSEPTFRPSGASNHWKNTVFRDFPTFSLTCIFFLLTLPLLWSSLCCSSLLFFYSYRLCFLSVDIVGSLTSKLPSTIWIDVKLLMTAGGRWGTLQSAANEDAAMFLWKPACICTVPPLGAYKSQLEGIYYSLPLLFYTVNVYYDCIICLYI